VRVPFRSREQRRGRHDEAHGSTGIEETATATAAFSSPSEVGSINGESEGEALENPDSPVTVDAPENLDVAPPSVANGTFSTRIDSDTDTQTATLAAAATSPDGSPAAPTIEASDETVTSNPVPTPLQLPELSEVKNPKTGTRVVAVANQKGGVGKTTTAVNLGASLAEIGFRVLVIDLDPQGNATTGLGIDARSFENSMYDVMMKDIALEDCIEPTSLLNLFVAPATIDLAGAEIELVPAFSREFKLRKAIQTVIDDFDYILIDCPPSLGLITINGLAAAHEVLVPIQCEYYALEGLGQLLRNVQLVQSNLNETLEVSTIVLTMYDARTKLADQVATEVRAHFGARVCRVVIPRTVRISEAPSFGQPITVFDPTSRGAIAYRELAKEVSGVET
jgi:chromosome partitioning protein